MSTPIIDRDLTKQAPHSPRDRIGGFAIASRTVDKCRASQAGTLGEYHYDCPLDTATSASFDSGTIASGQSWRHTFMDAGEFPYTCAFHPQMKGVIIVK